MQPVLVRLGLGSRQFTDRQREILAVPINLQIFATLVSAGEVVEGDITGARLFDRLLEVRARELHRSGVSWSPHTALAALASWMSAHQALAAPATVLVAFPGATDTLSSHGLITKASSRIQFAHESFFDHVFSAEFVTRGGSVLALLTREPQRLFRRTQVRQIFARLRDQGGQHIPAQLARRHGRSRCPLSDQGRDCRVASQCERAAPDGGPACRGVVDARALL